MPRLDNKLPIYSLHKPRGQDSTWNVDSGYLAENIAKLERQHQVPYRMSADEGRIVLTDGNTIDYECVKDEILEIASQRKLIKLITDPYNAKKLAEDLLNLHGLPVEYHRQGYLSLSDPTKTLHELIMGQRSATRDIRSCAGTRATRSCERTRPATSSSIRRSRGERSTAWRRSSMPWRRRSNTPKIHRACTKNEA